MRDTTLIWLLALASQVSAQCGPFSTTKPILFNEENVSLTQPIPIPPRVLQLLLKTDAARQGLDSIPPADRSNVNKYFRATRVPLTSGGCNDLVIRGEGRMDGADNDWYWVVSSYHQNPRVVLFVGTLSLELLPARNGGYRDIRSEWNSAAAGETRVFRFSRGRYRLARDKWKDKERRPDASAFSVR